MVQGNFIRNGFIGMSLVGLVGCSSISSVLESDRIDYKSATSKSSVPALEIPPDLTQLQRDNRYALPAAAGGTVTASGYQQQQATRPATAEVAPKGIGTDMRIERSGSQRWLVVRKSPEELWPKIKEFWQDSGFMISVENQDTGVMETDWAENRAKIPLDIVRRTLGKVLDTLYSTGELDKFRTRLERGPDGTTEIFISHRGAQEELIGSNKETSKWTPRPSDPELEAEFLSRLMVRLGAEGERAKSVVKASLVTPSKSSLMKTADVGYIQVDEGFDRAWRRVGLALDRVGFTVEDRDRSQGLYFVRYVDQEKAAGEKASKSGFFAKWLSFGSKDDPAKAQRFRISVKGSGQTSQVSVQGEDGRPDHSANASKILTLLNEQLK